MLKREAGFTLIELIAVMLILGIIAATVIVKFGLFEGNATQRTIDLAISELNTREKLTWSNVKLGECNESDFDDCITAIIDWDIGNGTNVSETSISVRGHSATVVRTPATRKMPAIWTRQ